MKWRPVLLTISGICVFVALAVRVETPGEVTSGDHASQVDDSLRRFARVTASYELAKTHSRELETFDHADLLWNELFEQMLVATEVDATYKARFLRPSDVSEETAGGRAGEEGGDAAFTEFEIQAVKKIKQGAHEVLECPTPQHILYVRSIDVLKSCVFVCHSDAERLDRVGGLNGSNRIDGMMISLQITLHSQNEDKKEGEGKGGAGEPVKFPLPSPVDRAKSGFLHD